MTYDPFDYVPGADPDAPLFLTCEHATNLMPPGTKAHVEDLPWLDTHWGWDPGAAALTRALAAHFSAEAAYSRFSRLVIDPNREPDAPDLIRRETEGHVLSFNAEVDEVERARRWTELHEGFHDRLGAAIGRRVARETPFLLFSVHTFTPIYMGEVRDIEFGVLFDQHDELAEALNAAIADAGLITGLNVPYSGKEGLIYSAHRHGTAHDVPYIEIEARQDLLTTDEGVARVATRVIRALEAVLPRITAS